MSARGSSFRRVICRACVVAVATLLPAALAGAAWTFSQDFDSGSLNVAATAVSGGLVTLEPRRFASPEWAGDHWWMYFQASGVNGATPTFRVPVMEMFQPFQSGHRFVYSYDRVNWSFFDSGEYGYNQQYYRQPAYGYGQQAAVSWAGPPAAATRWAVPSRPKTSTPTASATSAWVGLRSASS